MPLHMRLPKLKGFKNPAHKQFQVVNLDKLAALYPQGGEVTVADLVAKGAVRKNELVKVLASSSASATRTARTSSPTPSTAGGC
ncbi:Large ribosomal subunit protein uL15 OS=Streptomyces rimosus subsp. rimosus (strain ATCC / DSM 40260 / JCM 4667 / NRRL 2234) OX=1265868 GN=rplO PE=3 SV=1 [Streptomyces rimosus subsp. rimosus]